MSERATDIAARIQVRKQVLGCERCGLRTVCTKPVPFSGDAPSPIVIVGEAPGKEEDATGRPFVGPAGTLLRKRLDAAMGDATGASFSDSLAYVNVVSCYPKRTPHASEVESCRDNLDAQLRILAPWYALVVGGVAVSAWWPKIRIGDLRGRWWKETKYREDGKATWLFATWHPSAVLRSGGMTSKLGREFSDDLVMFSQVIQDWKRPGLNVDCVKCGRGERRGRAEVWEKNLGACRKHAAAAGLEGNVTSVAVRRGSTRSKPTKTSATLRQDRGESSTLGTLFG